MNGRTNEEAAVEWHRYVCEMEPRPDDVQD